MKPFLTWLQEETIHVQWNDSGMDMIASISGSPEEIKKVGKEVNHTKHMKIVAKGSKDALKIKAKAWLAGH